MLQSPNHQAPPRKPLTPWLILTLAVLAALAPFFLMQGGEDIVSWRSDVDDALIQAKATGKPVLIDFTADWCPPCRTMKQQVFSKQNVKSYVETHFIPVQLDLSQKNEKTSALGQRFRIQYLPTMVILSPDGTELRRESGGMSEVGLLEWLKPVESPVIGDDQVIKR